MRAGRSLEARSLPARSEDGIRGLRGSDAEGLEAKEFGLNGAGKELNATSQ